MLKEADHFQEELQKLGESFSNIDAAAGQFVHVREEIGGTVSEAQGLMEELKSTSMKIQQSYDEMAGIFGNLESAIRGIQQCMGFAVVAAQVKELAKEIKQLAGEVDTGVCDVETRAGELSSSIQSSQQTLNQEIGIVGQTDESFRKIIATVPAGAGGALPVLRPDQGSVSGGGPAYRPGQPLGHHQERHV